MEEYSEKQIAILKVAEKLFAHQGFHGTSVRDIAQEAKMNIAMVSYYFGSKEKLLEAIFKLRTDTMRRFLNELLENDLQPLEKINSIIEHFADRLEEEQYFHSILCREQLNSRQKIVQELVWKMRKEIMNLLQLIVTRGQEAGTFHKDVDVEMMLITLLGTIHRTIATQSIMKKNPPCEAMNEEEFKEHLKGRVSKHLKKLFKAILTYEL